ncbi:MAG: tagaturonate reductase [Clostridiaceae bacterium]
MERLSYKVVKEQNKDFFRENAPERVLQFGEGNFLRGFVDYFFDLLNEKTDFNGKVVIVQPIEQGNAELINEQEGLYTLYLRGLVDGEPTVSRRLISSVSRAINPYKDFDEFLKCAVNPDLRYVVSNTTEAGIVFDGTVLFEDRPQKSFPAKLTRFLFERWKFFGEGNEKGLVVLSCELIADNGKELHRFVLETAKLWKLSENFIEWIEKECLFCNTLVDRIVTGYPRTETVRLNEENGYEDKLLDTGEPFAFWAIEAPEWLRDELPLEEIGWPIIFVPDQSPYKKRKVRILNGAQTGVTLAAYLSGHDIGRAYMNDPLFYDFVKGMMFEEIIPVINMDEDEAKKFATDCLDRLSNPFIDHSLLAISLNSVSKWRARDLPTFKDYYAEKKELPKRITLSLAALLAFYTGNEMKDGSLIGHRGEEAYKIMDDENVLMFMQKYSTGDDAEFVHAYMTNKDFHGEDLTEYLGFADDVLRHLRSIRSEGMRAVLEVL